MAISSALVQSGQKQEDLLKQQFAAARQQVQGGKLQAVRDSQKSMDRLTARVGGTVGGSIEKMKQKEMTNLNRGFAEAEAGVTAQEGQALQGLEAQQQGLQVQQDQFDQTMQFQKDSWADQMKYQWAEMDENKKTNMVNAFIALKDAGTNSSKDWSNLFNFMGGAGYENLPENFGVSKPNTTVNSFAQQMYNKQLTGYM